MALMMVFVAGCGLNVESNGKTSNKEKGTIKIGGTLPLTGPFAETGLYIRDGYNQWVEETNAKGGLKGKKVELEILDDQSDQSKAVSMLENLISQKNVDLLIGGYPGSSAAAQMGVAEQHNMVYVSMGGHMTSFKKGFKYSFGAPPLMGEWWYSSFFDWLKKQPKEQWPKNAAMITVNDPVGNAYRNGTLEKLKSLGIEVVVDELYQLPLNSAEPLVNKAKQAGAELFIANGYFGDGVQTVRAIKAIDYKPKAILQGIGTLIPSWEEELGDEGNYVFSGTMMHPDLPFEGTEKLNEVSMKKYGIKAPPYFMFGYAWMQVLGQAVEGAGKLDQEAIRDWLRSNTVKTVGGNFTFDEKGLPKEYSYLIQVIDGRPVLVWPEKVATDAPVYPYPHK
jgi:branched-chain amino acid transport system substrate-binding protein